jgi:hypothetical protein
MEYLLDRACRISTNKNMNPFEAPSGNQKNKHLHHLECKIKLQVILDNFFFVLEVLTLIITI